MQDILTLFFGSDQEGVINVNETVVDYYNSRNINSFKTAKQVAKYLKYAMYKHDSATLKYCPFCGHKAVQHSINNKTSYKVGCPTCKVYFISSSLAVAVRKWNKRI